MSSILEEEEPEFPIPPYPYDTSHINPIQRPNQENRPTKKNRPNQTNPGPVYRPPTTKHKDSG